MFSIQCLLVLNDLTKGVSFASRNCQFYPNTAVDGPQNGLKIYFCGVKWKALIALFVLAATVLIPAAQSVMAENEVSLFLVDEEKGDSQGKSFSPTEEHLPAYSDWTDQEIVIRTYTPSYELPVDRALEMRTPPPDHC